MPTYRLYGLDGAGRISGADWIDAADDGEACATASAQYPGGRFELWQKSRLVDSVSATQKPAATDQL